MLVDSQRLGGEQADSQRRGRGSIVLTVTTKRASTEVHSLRHQNETTHPEIISPTTAEGSTRTAGGDIQTSVKIGIRTVGPECPTSLEGYTLAISLALRPLNLEQRALKGVDMGDDGG